MEIGTGNLDENLEEIEEFAFYIPQGSPTSEKNTPLNESVRNHQDSISEESQPAGDIITYEEYNPITDRTPNYVHRLETDCENYQKQNAKLVDEINLSSNTIMALQCENTRLKSKVLAYENELSNILDKTEEISRNFASEGSDVLAKIYSQLEIIRNKVTGSHSQQIRVDREEVKTKNRNRKTQEGKKSLSLLKSGQNTSCLSSLSQLSKFQYLKQKYNFS